MTPLGSVVVTILTFPLGDIFATIPSPASEEEATVPTLPAIYMPGKYAEGMPATGYAKPVFVGW